ncbi:MAG: hypothetical protein P4L84_31730 [Isosphaeraceae bacterium]|nr:hypothetical protein [Isosphaeraceae bacterium]
MKAHKETLQWPNTFSMMNPSPANPAWIAVSFGRPYSAARLLPLVPLEETSA